MAAASGLVLQVLLLPLLWAHSSDSGQVLGRFSWSFTVILVINLAAILFFAFLLWRRSWFDSLFQRPAMVMTLCGVMGLAVIALFALSQIRSIHWRAETYLALSGISFAFVLFAIATGTAPYVEQKKRLWGAVTVITLFLLSFAALVAVSLWGQGFLFNRVFAPATYLLMLCALYLGLGIGAGVKRLQSGLLLDAKWNRLLVGVNVLFAVIIAAGIVLGQAQRLPYHREAAQIWDTNHREIMRLIDAGDAAVYEREYTHISSHTFMDSSLQINYRPGPLASYHKLYYGLEYSISLE